MTKAERGSIISILARFDNGHSPGAIAEFTGYGVVEVLRVLVMYGRDPYPKAASYAGAVKFIPCTDPSGRPE